MKISPFWGTNGQLMVMAAHRYCLGRQSYIVGACIEWLKSWWNQFEINTKRVIIRDTVEALQDDFAGSKYDKEEWTNFAEWAYNSLNITDKERCRDAVKHRNKPWPLTTP